MGTIGYLAPEQFLGKSTEQSDVFGLGATLYELATLTPAFPQGSNDPDSTFVDPCSVNSFIPNELSAIICKACEHKTSSRYESAQDLADDLLRFANDQPPKLDAAQSKNKVNIRKAVAIAACAAVAAFVGGYVCPEYEVRRVEDQPSNSFVSTMPAQVESVTHNKSRFLLPLHPQRTHFVNHAKQTVSLAVPVSFSSDDAEEKSDGRVQLLSRDLELTWDTTDQVVGMRFVDIRVPARAQIQNAYLQFQAEENCLSSTSLTLRAEATDSARTFSKANRDISSRELTEKSVYWNPPTWPVKDAAGPLQRTPDCSSFIQEIVDRPKWESGGAIAVIIRGTGHHSVVSFDGAFAAAPVLHIEYAIGSSDRNSPGVN